MTPYILCLFSNWIISIVIRCWVPWVPCIFWILLSYLLYCKYCLPFCRMSFHFVDCFFPWAEAFMFDMVSLVDYCFCWLCFWYCIQNFTAKVPVEKLIPCVFCRPGSPLSHALLQASTRSTEIWALVAVSPASLLSVWPPVVRLCKVRPERTSREASWSRGETGCPPWVLSSPLEKPWVRGRGCAFSVWPRAGLGMGSEVKRKLLLFPC